MGAEPSTHDSAVVPSVSVPSTLACLRSLSRRDVRTIVVSEFDLPEAACSTYCDESVRVPSPERSFRDYRDGLLAVARRPDVKAILPVREKDVFVLSKYREQFGEHIGTPFPSFETLRRVQDRVRLFDAAEQAGVSTPETHLLTECDDWSREWIVKGRYSLLADTYLGESPTNETATGGTAATAGETATATDETAATAGEPTETAMPDGSSRQGLTRPPSTKYLPAGEEPDAEALVEEMHHVPLVQEYLPTPDEYGFFAIYDRGEALSTFQHRQIRGFHYSGGASAYRESVSLPELEREGRKLLDHLDWHGPAMVEFKRNERTGEFELMEINPRFWSSLPFSVTAGADFPYYYWSLATGNPDRITTDYESGIGGHLLMGELFYLRSLLGGDVNLVEKPSLVAATATVLASLVRDPRFDYLDLSDPCPFLRYGYNQLRKALAQ